MGIRIAKMYKYEGANRAGKKSPTRLCKTSSSCTYSSETRCQFGQREKNFSVLLIFYDNAITSISSLSAKRTKTLQPCTTFFSTTPPASRRVRAFHRCFSYYFGAMFAASLYYIFFFLISSRPRIFSSASAAGYVIFLLRIS